MTELTYQLSLLCYLGAAGVGWLDRGGQSRGRAVSWLLGVGAGVQTLGFIALHRQAPPIPLESFPAALSLIAWLSVVAYLLSLRLARFPRMGVWVALGAAAVTLAAELGLRFGPPPTAAVDDGGMWPHAHVLLSTGGFSLLALASLAGSAYLTKEHALKRKTGSLLALPSLESLDRVEHLMLSLGFPLLTLGVITGFLWGSSGDLNPWTGHALWLLGAWAVYLVPVSLRVVQRQHGPRPARSVVLGFAVLTFCYVGVRLLGAVT